MSGGWRGQGGQRRGVGRGSDEQEREWGDTPSHPLIPTLPEAVGVGVSPVHAQEAVRLDDVAHTGLFVRVKGNVDLLPFFVSLAKL